MVEPENEAAQIRASQGGCPTAFAALITRYQHMIHALTFRMTGTNAEAEDLAQETFIQAWRQLDQFRGDAKFSSWLYRIAMNLCLNWQKRRSRQATLHEKWGVEASLPAETHAEDRLSRPIQEALLRLPEKQRAAIILTTYDGLSHAEAAQVLGCSETTVSWRLFAARHKLKKWLKHLQTPGA